MWESTYGLLTKWDAKMAGYWASSFFGLFMDRDGVKVHKVAKRNKANIMIHSVILTEQA